MTLGDFEDEVGIVLALEWDGAQSTVTEVTRFRPEASRAVKGKGFTGGTLVPGGLLVCGFNAVYRVDLANGQVNTVLIRDDFNDLHHVALHGEQLWVANTGRDRIEAFDFKGEHLGIWPLAPHPSALQQSASDPYFAGQTPEVPLYRRRLMDLVHPNGLAFGAGQILVARFSDNGVEELISGRRVITATPGCPHDPCFVDDELWLTCTNGLVVRYAPAASLYQERQRFNVFEASGQLGWCRGLHVGPTLLAVGLTRITRMPRTRWGDWPFELTRTGVVLLDRTSAQLQAWIDLGAWGKHPKLFSVLPFFT